MHECMLDWSPHSRPFTASVARQHQMRAETPQGTHRQPSLTHRVVWQRRLQTLQKSLCKVITRNLSCQKWGHKSQVGEPDLIDHGSNQRVTSVSQATCQQQTHNSQILGCVCAYADPAPTAASPFRYRELHRRMKQIPQQRRRVKHWRVISQRTVRR